jgi:hypothetical protein
VSVLIGNVIPCVIQIRAAAISLVHPLCDSAS